MKNKLIKKTYNFFGDYLTSKYNSKVFKLSINAGLGCPNRDNRVGQGGCIFCSEGSQSPYSIMNKGIKEQMLEAARSFKRGSYSQKYIAYFQAFTNTYGPVHKLKKIYDEAVEFNDVIGLMIGTRPDCINEDVLKLISDYKKKNFELWLEIGMQSMHDKSLQFLNRGHNHKQTVKAIEMVKKYGIDVCVHIILGIPGETWDDMMETALELNRLDVQGVKIHHLHVIKNTELYNLYKKGEIKLLTLEKYVSYICDFIERLKSEILIHRLSGDQPKDMLVAPKWGLHKGTIIKLIEDEFVKRGTYQGFLVDNFI